MDLRPEVDQSAIDIIKSIGLRRSIPDYYGKILKMFSKQAEDIIWEIDSALQSENQTSLFHLVHKLKGGAQSVGAKSLEKECAELQDLAEAEKLDFVLAKTKIDKIKTTISESIKFLTAETLH